MIFIKTRFEQNSVYGYEIKKTLGKKITNKKSSWFENVTHTTGTFITRTFITFTYWDVVVGSLEIITNVVSKLFGQFGNLSPICSRNLTLS